MVWTPSHVDPGEPSLTPAQRHLAIGNSVADEFAGEAARRSRVPALGCSRPPDIHMSECTAHITRKAAQAMIDSIAAATSWVATRPKLARKSVGVLDVALRISSHCSVRSHQAWACAPRLSTRTGKDALEARSGHRPGRDGPPDDVLPPGEGVARAPGRVTVDGIATPAVL